MRTPSAIVAAAFTATLTATALTACSPADEPRELPDATDTADTGVKLDTPAAPQPTGPVERDPDEFNVSSDPQYPAYSVQVSEHAWCVYYDKGAGRDGYFDCSVELAGDIPPLDLDNSQGTAADMLMWDPATGFITTHDVGGGEGTPPAVNLAPGETVAIAGYTFTQLADGTARVERENHWFEVSPDGQYSSDRF